MRGGERPRWFHYLPPAPRRDANLLTSDWQEPLPNGAGCDGIPGLTTPDTSQRCVLVPDVDGCFG